MADPYEGTVNWGEESSGAWARARPHHPPPRPASKPKPKSQRGRKGGEEIKRSSHTCLSSFKKVKPVQLAAAN